MTYILIYFYDHQGNRTDIEAREDFFKLEIIPKLDQLGILWTTRTNNVLGYNVISQQIPTNILDLITADNLH